MKAYNIREFGRYKLNNVNEVSNAIEHYFKSVSAERKDELTHKMYTYFFKPPTLVGLAKALGITKATLDDYYHHKGKEIPSCEEISKQIEEVEQALKENRFELSFTGRIATPEYHQELLNAVDLRKIINCIQWGYAMIEDYNNDRLYDSQGHRGSVFILKNSFGYKDKQEVEISGSKKFEDFMSEDILED